MQPSSLSDEVLALLRCPETGQALRAPREGELDAFDGEFPEGAWITEDGSRAYPVRDGFPVLVAAEAVRRGDGRP